jgi:hypothetical protein
MTKVTYSGLVSGMSGRLNGSVCTQWKGKGVLRRYIKNIRQPRNEAQQTVRGLLSDLSGEFYSLTQIQKDLWTAYASALPTALTPLNAFVRLNQVLQKYFPGMTRLSAPPSTPSTPEHIAGFTVSAIGSGDYCVEWTGPSTGTDVAVVDYWPMPGLDNNSNPAFKFGVSADCTDLCVALATTYPAGTVMKFRARTVDLFGRTSPWTSVLSVTTI